MTTNTFSRSQLGHAQTAGLFGQPGGESLLSPIGYLGTGGPSKVIHHGH